MRDSQSLFDQLLAFGGETIGPADVHRLLGTAPDDRLLDLIAALIAHDPARALQSFHASLDAGAQLGELTDQLLAALRDLMVLAAGAAEAGLLSIGEDQRPVLLRHASAWGLSSILAALQVLSEAKARMKGVTYGRVLAELALVRIASLEDLERLGEAVALLKSGKAAIAGPVAPTLSRSQPVSAVMPPPPRIEASPGRPAPPPAPRPEAAGVPPYSKGSEQVTSADQQGDDRPDDGVAPVCAIPFESGRENEIWAQVITILSDMTRSHAKNVTNAAISGPNQLVLTFPKSYHLSKQYFERSPDQIRRIEAAIQQVVGQTVKIVLTVSQSESPSQPPAEQQSSRAEVDRRHMEAENDPLVKRAMTAFGATVVRVEAASGPLNE
jgi:DNA polymerase-3 subunit gamma/tau